MLWIKPGTLPSNDVMAEIPRYKDMNNPIVKKLVELVKEFQIHRCVEDRCLRSGGKKLKK